MLHDQLPAWEQTVHLGTGSLTAYHGSRNGGRSGRQSMESKSRELATEYFHGALKAAIKNQGVAASEPTECYLVGLLAEHLKGPVDDEPLALKLASAVVSSPDERLRHLKDLGDTSLYVSGFFSDSLARKLVD